MVTIELMPSRLGQRIRVIRTQRDLLIKELAQRAHVPMTWLQAVETGEIANPPADRVAAVAEALGVDVGYLITGKDRSGQPMTEADAIFRGLSNRLKDQALKLIHAIQDDALEVRYPDTIPAEGTEGERDEHGTGTEGNA